MFWEQNKKLILTTILIAFLAFSGYSIFQLSARLSSLEKRFEQLLAQNLLLGVPLSESPNQLLKTVMGNVLGVSGTVSAISSDKLTLKATFPDVSKPPQKDGVLPTLEKNYNVVISGSTKIFLLKAPSGDEKEGQKTPIAFEELKAGDQVAAIANENILNKTEFIAKEIVLFKK